MEYTLPSDSMFREDLYWFKRGNVDLAQRCKMSIEEVQRNDNKLRQKNKGCMKLNTIKTIN